MLKEMDRQLVVVRPIVRNGIKNICVGIIDAVVEKNGKLTISDIEEFTGLKKIGINVIGQVVGMMIKTDLIRLQNGIVYGDVAKLTKLTSKVTMEVPQRHNKLWNDKEIEQLCELALQGMSFHAIGKILKRTENACGLQAEKIRYAAQTICPLMEKSRVVRDFGMIQVREKAEN